MEGGGIWLYQQKKKSKVTGLSELPGHLVLLPRGLSIDIEIFRMHAYFLCGIFNLLEIKMTQIEVLHLNIEMSSMDMTLILDKVVRNRPEIFLSSYCLFGEKG